MQEYVRDDQNVFSGQREARDKFVETFKDHPEMLKEMPEVVQAMYLDEEIPQHLKKEASKRRRRRTVEV